MNFYVIDLLYLLLMYIIIRVLISSSALKAIKNEPIYLFFLLWLVFEIIIGLTRYGFRAIGETRLASSFLTFFIPYYLLSKKQQSNSYYIMDLIQKTVICSAVACLFLYILNLLSGHDIGVEDFRGIRYIGSTHTFYITIMICFYAFKYTFENMLSFKEVLLLLISLVIAIFSKNRAGLIFPGTLTLLLYARYSRIKIFILIVLIAVIAVLVIITVTPDSVLTEVDKAFSGALNPSTDQTGRWRIAIQLVALEQAFETFWLGQGYGSYFNLVVPERYQNILYEISPHNQFLVTFLKSGIIGVLLLVSLLGSYIYKSLKCVDKIPDNAHEKLFILLLLVIVSSQIFYGMTYDFIPFFGLYYGFGALLIRSIKLNTTNCVKNNNPL